MAMDPIRRHKRSRMTNKLEVPIEPVESAVEPARFARGTVPQVRLRLEDMGPILGADNIDTVVGQLRSPLAAISLELCLLEEARSPGVERVLRRIVGNLAALERTAAELADAAAIERGQLCLDRRSNELRSLVGEVLDRVLPLRERVRCCIEAHAACLAAIDGPRIERVILTLVEAALAESPRDAPIVIELVQLGLVARLSVSHAGRNLSQLEADSAFDRTTGGLGMFVARSIVEAHGGDIGVERHVDLGTRYYLDLPLANAADPVHVLLVDDDERQLGALAYLLEREGFEVTCASCGSAAITALRAHAIDVAVVDVELPDVPCKELAMQLRDRCPTMPIIMVSGHPADSAHVIEALGACEGRYVGKPIELESLVVEIARSHHRNH